MIRIVRIHEKDNVVIALEPVPVDSVVCDSKEGEFRTTTKIPMFHKIATENIAKGEPIFKYGSPIGIATQDILKGAHVHIHNLDSLGSMVDHVEGGK